MNKVILIGNLTKDPEVNVTSNDLTNCRFTVAVKRKYSRDGKAESDFFTVVSWRGLAENCGKYLRKGSRVGVSGSIQNRSYEGSDGIKRYTVEIVADEVQFLSTKMEDEAIDDQPTPVPAKKPVKISDLKAIEDDDDDLPF